MEINWTVVIIAAVPAVALIIFLIKRNQKDKKSLEKELNATEKTDELESNDDDDMV